MKNLLQILILMCFVAINAQTQTLHLADSLYLHGNYTKAIEAYKNHKNQDEVYDKIAKAYIALGNYDEALINYENSLKKNPKDALTLFDYGKLLTRVKKHKEALEVFYKLIDIDYRNPNYHYESGLVMQKLGDSTSQNRFRTAFDLDNTHQKTIFQIAKHHLTKRHHKVVDRYIDIGLSTYANNKELISLKAQNFYWKEDYGNAAKWFEKLLELNESSQFIHEKLSFCYDRVYEPEKAIEHQLIALKFDPKNATNLFILGQLYQDIDDFKNAEKYYKESLALLDKPLDAEYIKLAGVYSRQKKYKESIDAYKKAIDENPKNERAHFLSIYVKDQYYEDIDARIKLFENFNNRFPQSKFKTLVNYKIDELKKEKFMKTD
ncbi:tetratricopeptide repeat protein [Pontimicrobium sp. SW4]|uniref:Tetratricopeptide repeat protein n=1 Tax=Pontimicrobium sp. SW4 TaxID=3153519 RepID=A0AAU7BTM6_9FLAO